MEMVRRISGGNANIVAIDGRSLFLYCFYSMFIIVCGFSDVELVHKLLNGQPVSNGRNRASQLLAIQNVRIGA